MINHMIRPLPIVRNFGGVLEIDSLFAQFPVEKLITLVPRHTKGKKANYMFGSCRQQVRQSNSAFHP
jgi:hypothetical protein